MNFIFLSESSLTKSVEKVAPSVRDFPFFFLEMVKEKTIHKSLIHSWWLSARDKTFGGMYTIWIDVRPGILVHLWVSYPVHTLQGSWFPGSLSSHEWAMLGPPCERDLLSTPSTGAECPNYPQRQGAFKALSPENVRKHTLICSHLYFFLPWVLAHLVRLMSWSTL